MPQPKQIWGKLLTRLRESGEAALFVSCGEISDVSVEDGALVARTDKEYISDLISTNENILTIKRALRFLGFNLDFKVVKIVSKDADEISDINFLKEKFDNLVVE